MINKVQSTNSFGMAKKTNAKSKKIPVKPTKRNFTRVRYTKEERAAVATMGRVLASLPALLDDQFARGIRGCI